MFTVEYTDASSIITAMDEQDLHEDLKVDIHEDGTVFLSQYYPDTGENAMLYISYEQLRDVLYSLDASVGVYQVEYGSDGRETI